MPIPVACRCGKRFQAKEQLAGRQVKCPNCGSPLAIPQITQPLEPDSSQNPFSDSNSLPDNAAGPVRPSPYNYGTPAPHPTVPVKRANPGLIVGLCIGGGVLALLAFVFVAAVVWWAASRGSESDAVAAANGYVEPVKPNMPSPIAAPVATDRPALTDEECFQAATEFSIAIMNGDVASAQGFVDFSEVLRRVTADIDASPDISRGFSAGFLSKTGNGGFERQLIQSIQNGGQYRALRVHHVGDEIRVWMRMDLGEQGLNYQDLIFVRGADGRPHVADMYLVTSGELFSQTMRRMYIPIAASANRNLLQRLTSAESDFVKYANEFQQITTQARTQPAAALAAYRRLPESLRKNKSLMLIRVQVAAGVSEQEYQAAISDFRKEFPTDAAVEMLSIDWHLLRKEYDKSLAAVNAVDRVVGGDPYLDTLRANIMTAQGKFDEAETFANKALGAEPTLPAAYWSLINVSVRKGDFDATLQRMKRLDNSFQMQWGDLREVPEYAPFVNSPQYQQWLAYLESR